MSKIRESLIARITKSSSNGKGLVIGKGYSSTWNKVAEDLKTEGKIEFRGGRLFMVGVTANAPKPVSKPVSKKVSKPANKPVVAAPKVNVKPTPAKRKFVDLSLPTDTKTSAPKA
jgi:hypothetical protein